MQESRFQNYRFEDLEVWQLGMKIVHEAYRLTGKFPSNEKFGLADQLRRASTSIVLNIAEGSGQPTAKGFILYLRRARSSGLECVACIKIALQERFLTEKETEVVIALLREEYFKLIAFEKSLKTNI